MDLVRGNPTEVKVVLASVATALAVYQLVLAGVFYRKLRPSFLDAGPGAFTHRASGDTIAVTGALLVALAIVAITIIAVTAQLGPTSAAELEAGEDRLEDRGDR